MGNRKSTFIDLTGQVFTDLEVIRNAGQSGKVLAAWICRCVCSREIKVDACVLLKGGRKSCGCQRKKNISKAKATHGLTKTPEYVAWQGMKRRCGDETRPDFIRYGARGIEVCRRWLDSFEDFLRDMGKRPQKGYSLERKDNSKGYSPDNCIWADWKAQERNRDNNHLLTFRGETKTVAEWAESLSLRSPGVLYKRLESGWSDERTLSEPIHYCGSRSVNSVKSDFRLP